MRTPISRRFAPALAAGTLATLAVVVPMHADAAGAVRATCTATVGYQAGALSSTYSNTFTVTAARPFVDDRSTVLRADVFSATVVGSDVQVSYFKDVNTFDSISIDTTVSLASKTGAQAGRHVFATSNTDNRVTTYSISCTR
jgi:hypothetical protein